MLAWKDLHDGVWEEPSKIQKDTCDPGPLSLSITDLWAKCFFVVEADLGIVRC